jgi:hypothetical protein
LYCDELKTDGASMKQVDKPVMLNHIPINSEIKYDFITVNWKQTVPVWNKETNGQNIVRSHTQVEINNIKYDQAIGIK